MEKIKRRLDPQILAYLAIVCISIVLRFWYLDAHSLWTDEIKSLWRADPDRSLADAFENWRSEEAHPQLYYFVLYEYLRVFPYTTEFARLFSVLFGVLGVFLTGLVARELWGSRAGCIAAAITALHNFHFFYSQEVRSYAFIYFIAALTLWVYQRARSSPGWLNIFLCGFVLALNCYAHYFGFLFIAIAGLVYLMATRFRPFGEYRWVLYTFVLCAALVLPLTGFVLEDYAGKESYWADPVSFSSVAYIVVQMAGGKWATALILVLFIWGSIQRQIPVESRWCFLFAALFMSTVIIISLVQPYSVLVPRYFTMLLPVVLIGITGFMSHLSHGRFLVPILFFALAWPTLLADVNVFDRRGSGHNPRGLIEWIAKQEPDYPIRVHPYVKTLATVYEFNTIELAEYDKSSYPDSPFWIIQFHQVSRRAIDSIDPPLCVLEQRVQKREAAYLVRAGAPCGE